MRTLRIALVATAIGATAGAGVVVSLIAHPGSKTADSSIAAHALVTSVPAVNPASAAVAPAAQPAAAPAQAAAVAVQPSGASPPGEISAASANPATAMPDATNGAAPAQVAHVEEPAAAAAAPVHEDAAPAPDAAPAKKTAAKKHRVSGYEAIRHWQAGRGEAKKPRRDDSGFEPLFRLFSSRTGSPYSAN